MIEKMKCMAEKKECKLLLYVLLGVLFVLVLMCTIKHHCKKKKLAEKDLCREC